MIAQVDPRAPRFGQAITASVTLAGVILLEPALIYVVTALLVVPVVTRWRIDPYGWLWKRVVRRVLDPPAETESAIPHRFARVIGAIFTTIATALLVLATVGQIPLLAYAGFAVALIVGLLAALGATTGLCLGCRMYRQVSLFRDLGLLHEPADGQERPG